MGKSVKFNSTFVWVIGVIVASMVAFVVLFVSDSPKTLPKIKLSYFVDENEIVDSITKRLFQEIGQNKNYWIGIEPSKPEQFGLGIKLKNELEKMNKFGRVFVDSELEIPAEFLKAISATDVVEVKKSAESLGEELKKLEDENIPYLVFTASFYSTSMLVKNPMHRIKEKFPISPMTFSLAYLPLNAEGEKQMLVPCKTEDHSGLKEWACFVTNKSRYIRRKLELDNPKKWVGLMDLTSERDYALLINKK